MMERPAKSKVLDLAHKMIQVNQRRYNDFRRLEHEIQSLYVDFFVNANGVEYLLESICDDFALQLTSHPDITDHHVEKTISYLDIVKMYHQQKLALQQVINNWRNYNLAKPSDHAKNILL